MLVVGAEDRAGVRVVELAGDQLEPGGVRHQRTPRHRVVGGPLGRRASGPVDSAASATAWRAGA